MTLTVTEKEHWKGRISRKIDQAIEKLLATEDPNYLDRIRKEAAGEAFSSLGIADLKKEVDEIDAQKEALEERRTLALRRMLAAIRGVDVQSIASTETRYGEHHEVRRAVARRTELLEKELFAKDELGQRLLALQVDKEDLLDTVWLATSPKQIRDLWASVSQLLGESPTRLQKEALKIEPMAVSNK